MKLAVVGEGARLIECERKTFPYGHRLGIEQLIISGDGMFRSLLVDPDHGGALWDRHDSRAEGKIINQYDDGIGPTGQELSDVFSA